jgi:ParB/Sulfiredoxin domain
MSWRDKYKVHPAADVFPMMSDERLAELGEDIKKNGLTIPVLFWNGDGKGPVLIDGRNRLEACERVGVEPLTETFICKEPVTHISTSAAAISPSSSRLT